MRKTLLFVIFFAGISGLLCAQNTLPRLAVVEFSTNISNAEIKADAITVRNMVENAMIKTGKYDMITRDEIDKLIANQNIQVNSISSAENLKKLQLQNINYIVTGSVDAKGNNYTIIVKVLDVSTGKFSHSEDGFMNNNPQGLYDGMNTLMGKFTKGMSSDGDKVVQSEQKQERYSIGDTGPAGGIIFYVLEDFSGGLHYLEATPAKAEFKVQWGAYGKDVAGTGTAVGSGKKNTQLIVEYLKRIGESGKAAQLCASLNIGGYSDWFLPSKDELDLMYKNLKQKGFGGFSNDYYWSSSQSSINYAWTQVFYSGSQDSYVKDNAYSVRAIRAFSYRE